MLSHEQINRNVKPLTMKYQNKFNGFIDDDDDDDYDDDEEFIFFEESANENVSRLSLPGS